MEGFFQGPWPQPPGSTDPADDPLLLWPFGPPLPDQDAMMAQLLARAAAAAPRQPFAGDDPGGGFVGADQYQHAYSAAKPYWHWYPEGPNLVCPAELGCTADMIADQAARFAVPGLAASNPVVSGQTYPVRDPWFGAYGGDVRTDVSPDGLTITNTTVPGHAFHDGQIVRRFIQAPDGAWYATTHGFGNNAGPLAELANRLSGPKIFGDLDSQMLENVRRFYGK
jgi:hypothetical protein